MTRTKPTLENVSVRIKDKNGETKAFFPSVEKFVNFVTGSKDEGWYNKTESPQDRRPWYRKLLP